MTADAQRDMARVRARALARRYAPVAVAPVVVRGVHAVGVGVMALAVVCSARGAGPVPDLDVLRETAQADGFTRALAPRELRFPDDQGPHPDFRHEWWYVTGNLDSASGERFGFELTFFRVALVAPGAGRVGTATTANTTADGEGGLSRWRTQQVYLAHFAITDVARGSFRFAEKYSRGAVGLAGAQADPLRVWIDNWTLESRPLAAGRTMSEQVATRRVAVERTVAERSAPKGVAVERMAAERSAPKGVAAERVAAERSAAEGVAAERMTDWQLHAQGSGYDLSIDLRPLLAPVLNGEHGFSVKSGEPGAASYYYSIPRIAVQGRLLRGAESLDVHGLAWLDREWGSGALGVRQQGWDWFALQLQDGSALMFYSLRSHEGTRDPHSAGTWVDSAGRVQSLKSDDVRIDVSDYWISPRGGRYPSRWRLRVGAVGLDTELRPVLANQELGTTPRYWEGAVDVQGTQAGRSTSGRGYVELVGYAQ